MSQAFFIHTSFLLDLHSFLELFYIESRFFFDKNYFSLPLFSQLGTYHWSLFTVLSCLWKKQKAIFHIEFYWAFPAYFTLFLQAAENQIKVGHLSQKSDWLNRKVDLYENCQCFGISFENTLSIFLCYRFIDNENKLLL